MNKIGRRHLVSYCLALVGVLAMSTLRSSAEIAPDGSGNYLITSNTFDFIKADTAGAHSIQVNAPFTQAFAGLTPTVRVTNGTYATTNFGTIQQTGAGIAVVYTVSGSINNFGTISGGSDGVFGATNAVLTILNSGTIQASGNDADGIGSSLFSVELGWDKGW
jgi:hypothetical protein